jgi:transcription elongation GreA/GreB family factor
LESRIIEIEKLVDDVEIIDEKNKSMRGSSTIDYGSVVRIQFEDKKEYKITMV